MSFGDDPRPPDPQPAPGPAGSGLQPWSGPTWDSSPRERSGHASPGPVPTAVSVASLLLVVNLLLSVSVTVLALADFDQLARVALRHLAAGTDLRLARQTFRTALYVRVVANVAVGVLYVFLIVRLRQGRWRVWRRMVWLSGAGALGMLFLLTRPYPAVFHAEQAVQLVVLLGILACLLTPTTRAFIEPNPRRVPIGASTRR